MTSGTDGDGDGTRLAVGVCSLGMGGRVNPGGPLSVTLLVGGGGVEGVEGDAGGGLTTVG